MRIFLLQLLLALTIPVAGHHACAASLYKCGAPGAIRYSDQACGDGQAFHPAPLPLIPSAPSVPLPPSAGQDARPANGQQCLRATARQRRLQQHLQVVQELLPAHHQTVQHARRALQLSHTRYRYCPR